MRSTGLHCLLLTAFMVNAIAGLKTEQCGTLEKCEECCTTHCEECPTSVVCTDEQIDCGSVTPEPPAFCDPVKKCVPKNCDCPTKDNNGGECESFCHVTCDETETYCKGTTDARGCKTPDSCVPQTTSADETVCPGVCSPLNCPEAHIACPLPVDKNGCASSGTCVALVGKCTGVCPTTCKDDEIKCGGKTDDSGCAVADTCVKKGTDNSGALCPGNCPVECKQDEILCPGQVMPNGCKTADVCHKKAKDTNGEYCADNSASHTCHVECKEDETLCPGHLNQVGCKEPDVCKKMTKDKEGNYCPSTSVCHSPCKVNEISCAGSMDANGCKKPDSCLPRGRDYSGELCPTHCPGECKETQIKCSGKINDKGCKEPDACVDREDKLCGPDKGGVCSGSCPVECSPNEVKCSSQLDPCDCCPTEEVCRPAAKNINGVKCDEKSASHNCPKICKELEGEVLCPAYEDNLGCKPEAVCMPKAQGTNGNDCPVHSVCPKQCGSGELLCGDGSDSNNCKNADRCIPKGKDLDGILCTIECPPVCDHDTQVLCQGQKKANGCKGNDVCVPKIIGKDGAQCKTVCQDVVCAAIYVVISGGVDTNGCPLEDTCGLPKTFGTWTNDGTCTASGALSTCGPGEQKQIRTCTDGTVDKCTDAEKQRVITCTAAGTQLPACPTACVNGDVKLEADGTPMILWDKLWSPICGHFFWDSVYGARMFCKKMGYDDEVGITNVGKGTKATADSFWVGTCNKDDEWDTKCTGSCSEYKVGGECNGSTCNAGDNVAIQIECAGTPIHNPSCIEMDKQLGAWTNDGACEATGDDKTCGPGNQKQTRTCTDGTTETCAADDTARTTSCSDAGTALPACE